MTVVLTGALASVGATVAVAAAVGADEHAGSLSAAYQVFPSPVSTVEGPLKSLPALAAPAAASDAMPAAVQAQLGEYERTGKNLALAKRFTSTAGPAWVIPGRGKVCIAMPDRWGPAVAVPDYATVCGTSDEVAKTGLIAVIQDRVTGRADAAFVLPQGGRASITLSDGTTSPVTMDSQQGVVAAEVGPRDKSLSVSSPWGAASLDVLAPDHGPKFQDCGNGKVVPLAQSCS